MDITKRSLLVQNLPKGCTSEQVEDFLSKKIGQKYSAVYLHEQNSAFVVLKEEADVPDVIQQTSGQTLVDVQVAVQLVPADLVGTLCQLAGVKPKSPLEDLLSQLRGLSAEDKKAVADVLGFGQILK